MLRLLKAYRGPARLWPSLLPPLETPGLASYPLGRSPANGQTNWDVLSPFIPRCRAWRRAFLPSAATYSGEISADIWLPLAQTRLFARIFHGGNIAKRLCAARCANARRRRGSCRDRRFCLKRPAGRRGRRNIFTGRNRPLSHRFVRRSFPRAAASRVARQGNALRKHVLLPASWRSDCQSSTLNFAEAFFPARHGKSARKIPCKLPPLSSCVRGVPAPAIGPIRC